MIHKKIEQVEKEYLDKRKEYQQIKEQLEDYRRVSKRKTENLVDYILTIYRDVDIIHAKPFLSELEQNEEQMNKVYQRQIAEIEYQMLEDKKAYLKQIELLEAENQEEETMSYQIFQLVTKVYIRNTTPIVIFGGGLCVS